jgi:AcrR family transcriptional regulator
MTHVRETGYLHGPRANQTVQAILDATREIFLRRGYSGTKIEDITQLAGISRASFYTYFPSKRAALIALGADSLQRAMEMVQALGDISQERRRSDLEGWVALFTEYLEDYGSLVLAWTQAAYEDDEIRQAGQRGHLEFCRRLGNAVGVLGGGRIEDPVEQGLLVVSMLERAWAYGRLYGSAIDHDALGRIAARMLDAVAAGDAEAGDTGSDGS